MKALRTSSLCYAMDSYFIKHWACCNDNPMRLHVVRGMKVFIEKFPWNCWIKHPALVLEREEAWDFQSRWLFLVPTRQWQLNAHHTNAILSHQTKIFHCLHHEMKFAHSMSTLPSASTLGLWLIMLRSWRLILAAGRLSEGSASLDPRLQTQEEWHDRLCRGVNIFQAHEQALKSFQRRQ